MRIENYNNSQYFGANFTKEFTDFAHSYINTKPNRLKNNYIFNRKIEEFKNFGYDYLTIGLYQKSVSCGIKHSLVALKDGQDLKEGIVICSKTSLKYLLNDFLNMTKKEFITKLHINKKYEPV